MNSFSGWSIIASFILLDFPANTKRLSERERELAIKRLQYGRPPPSEEKMTHLRALKVAVTNWRLWLFVVGYMAIVGASTLSYFYPTLVQGLGYKGFHIQYMTVPIYGVACVCTIITSIVMDKKPHIRGYVLGGWMSLSMLCAIITCAVYDFKARYALLVLMASGLWASNALALAYASSTFGSMEAEPRGIALAIVNGMGNLASIYGSYLFPAEEAPKYLKGFGVISGLCFTGIMAYLALQILLRKYRS